MNVCLLGTQQCRSWIQVFSSLYILKSSKNILCKIIGGHTTKILEAEVFKLFYKPYETIQALKYGGTML